MVGLNTPGTFTQGGGTLTVGDRLAMTANREVLRDIARHQGPAKYLFAVGYAGSELETPNEHIRVIDYQQGITYAATILEEVAARSQHSTTSQLAERRS